MEKYDVYTPSEVALKMIHLSLNNYMEEEKSLAKLLRLKVCDLSCGTGNLLLPMLEALILLSKELTGNYIFNPNWITGFDINENAVNIIKRRGEELLKRYSLTGELSIFKEDGLSIAKESFDIILGNPPYLGEKNNKELFKKLKNSEFGMKFYEGKMDYFYFFIEKGGELLNNGGELIYLTTNYWLKADSGKKLRAFLKDEGDFKNILFYDTSLFSKAKGQHNIIFNWRKGKKNNSPIKIETPDSTFIVNNSDIYDENGKIVLADSESRKYIENILKNSNFKLQELVNINQGIVSGLDKAFVFESYEERFKEYLKPFYKNKDIGKYSNSKNKFWILYLDKNAILTPELERYLNQFYQPLSARREVAIGRIEWWQLQWARDKEIFSKPKILVRQRCKTNQFSYDDGDFFGSADIYFVTAKNENINIFFILGYMNSSTFLKWFKYNGKSKGKNYEFYSTPLKETPIYYPNNKSEIEYIEILVKKQITEYNEYRQKKIDEYFEKIFNK